MILGIGTDIVEVERIQRALENEPLKQKVFSTREITYCDKDKSCQSYAARAAGKEAFFKALGTGWRDSMKLDEVEILNDDLGKPFIELSGETLNVFEQKGGGAIHVSLSHIKQTAIAFVIIERK
ncbi:MAG TPA: holo-ACP synthase [Chitinophagales bacterium]|nr:holo-ACP synthase [Chitinophagales bacterium]